MHEVRCAENRLWEFAIRLSEVTDEVIPIGDDITTLESSHKLFNDSVDYSAQLARLAQWAELSRRLISDASVVLGTDIRSAFLAANDDAEDA